MTDPPPPSRWPLLAGLTAAFGVLVFVVEVVGGAIAADGGGGGMGGAASRAVAPRPASRVTDDCAR